MSSAHFYVNLRRDCKPPAERQIQPPDKTGHHNDHLIDLSAGWRTTAQSDMTGFQAVWAEAQTEILRTILPPGTGYGRPQISTIEKMRSPQSVTSSPAVGSTSPICPVGAIFSHEPARFATTAANTVLKGAQQPFFRHGWDDTPERGVQ